MGYWLKKLDAITDLQQEAISESQEQKDIKSSIVEIPSITLAEFARRDMAVEIYSELLKCNLWFCSNDEMATQIKEDAPGAVCYTVSELRYLLKLKPRPEDLRAIHEAKVINPDSAIMDVVMKYDTKNLGESEV